MSFLIPLIKPLAYISLPLFIVQQVANQPSPSPLRYYARMVVYVGTLFTFASCSFVTAVGMYILGRPNDTNHLVARAFHYVVHKVLDIRVEIEGEEFIETWPAVYMANHQSMLDIIVLGRAFPKKAAIMAKKSLQYSPLGPWMTLAGNIFVDRGHNARAIRSIEAAGELMKRDGISLWMFPEGTRHMSETPHMLPFKKGGFHLAINAGIPIVPIVVGNYWNIYHKGVFDKGVIKVKVLKPIPTTSMTAADVHTAAERVYQVMVETLREISPKVPASEKDDAKTATSSVSENPDEGMATSSSSSEKGLASAPLDSIACPIPPSMEPLPSSVGAVPISTDSSSSLASSSISIRRGKEDGAETEEDEGMVLVGRPRND